MPPRRRQKGRKMSRKKTKAAGGAAFALAALFYGMPAAAVTNIAVAAIIGAGALVFLAVCIVRGELWEVTDDAENT